MGSAVHGDHRRADAGGPPLQERTVGSRLSGISLITPATAVPLGARRRSQADLGFVGQESQGLPQVFSVINGHERMMRPAYEPANNRGYVGPWRRFCGPVSGPREV